MKNEIKVQFNEIELKNKKSDNKANNNKIGISNINQFEKQK
jgi:hypothetical protein